MTAGALVLEISLRPLELELTSYVISLILLYYYIMHLVLHPVVYDALTCKFVLINITSIMLYACMYVRSWRAGCLRRIMRAAGSWWR